MLAFLFIHTECVVKVQAPLVILHETHVRMNCVTIFNVSIRFIDEMDSFI